MASCWSLDGVLLVFGWPLVGLLLVSGIETKARLAEQRDRDYSLELDLTGFILGFIPGLLVLFLVSVRPYRQSP